MWGLRYVWEDMVSFGRTDLSFWRQVSWLHCTTSSRSEVLVWDMMTVVTGEGQDNCLKNIEFKNNDTKWVTRTDSVTTTSPKNLM